VTAVPSFMRRGLRGGGRASRPLIVVKARGRGRVHACRIQVLQQRDAATRCGDVERRSDAAE